MVPMSFPLLDLPNELVLEVISKVTSFRAVFAMLAIRPLRELIEANATHITDFEGPSVFPFSHQVHRASYNAVQNGQERLSKRGMLYFVDLRFINIENDAEQLKEIFNGTSTFMCISPLTVVFPFAALGSGALYSTLKSLNISSCLIDYDPKSYGKLDGDPDAPVSIDTNHIHYKELALGANAYRLEWGNGDVYMEVGEIENVVIAVDTKTDKFLHHPAKFFFPAAIRSVRVLAQDRWRYDRELFVPDYPPVRHRLMLQGRSFLETTKAPPEENTYELKDIKFNKLEANFFVFDCFKLENLEFPKLSGSRGCTLGLNPRASNCGSSSQRTASALERPMIQNFVAPKLRKMKLESRGIFPKIRNLEVPQLQTLHITFKLLDDQDFFQGLEPEEDLKFLDTVCCLTLTNNTSTKFLRLAFPHLQNLKELTIEDFDDKAENFTEFALPLLVSLTLTRFSRIHLPYMDAPLLESISVDFKYGTGTLGTLSRYPKLKSIKLVTDQVGYMLNAWPEDVPFHQLESLEIDPLLFKTPLSSIPTSHMPQLKHFITEGYAYELFGQKFNLNAPNLETLKITYPKPVNDRLTYFLTQHKFRIKGYLRLRQVHLSAMGILVIKNCPALEELRVISPHMLRELYVTDAESLREVEYYSKRARQVHTIKGAKRRLDVRMRNYTAFVDRVEEDAPVDDDMEMAFHNDTDFMFNSDAYHFANW